MATTITAGNATNGAAISSDNTGILELKTGTGSGTTALTLGTTGNINFPISGQRITGDFSNATVANRVLFQTSTTNNFTLIGAIPNGTSKYTQYAAWTGSTANESVGYMAVDGGVSGAVSFGSDRAGTGTYLPMLFFTGGSERARIDTSGNFQFNSGYGSVATAYGCRAWVNFNGTGAVAIRASGNVSSVADNGTGNYTVNFTNALPDANYSVAGAGSAPTTYAGGFVMFVDESTTPTTSAVKLKFHRPGTGDTDTLFCNVAIFR